ncbi:MAG: hypothetical protein A2X49_09125 [Lentisphaerae bacterium GWF2_52_8]|nr:MAG: hypothetical protein A2X49_09125 [Lentisphaerae bacterium GWF2_52_8]
MNLFKTPAELGETYLLFRNMENYPFTMPSELPADANSILELKLSELVEKLKKGPITKTLPPEEKPEEKKPEQKKEEAKDIKPAQAAPPVKAAEQKPAEKKPAEAKPASPPAPAAPAPPKTPPMDFLVDFGPKAGATPGNWNNLDDISNGRINNLISSDGRKSDVSLIVDDEFSATHDLGSKSDKIFPKTAGQDGFMVTGNGSIGKGNNLGVIRIENLEPKSIYNITIFASRSGPAGSKFASKFTIKGAKDTILCSDALDNKEKAVSANNVVPDASNTITINVTPYSQSGMQQEYGCINVLELKEVQNKR